LSNTPPATDRVPHQPLEASVLPERAGTNKRIDSQKQTCTEEQACSRDQEDSEEQANKVKLIPSLDPCLPSASYSFSLVSVLLRLPHCPPYSFITVHCSATPPEQDVNVAEIRRWHKEKGHNKSNIGICIVGGCNTELQPEDNFTLGQRKALFGLVAALQEQFLISDENVKGHKDWGVNKACPVVKLRE